MEPLITVRSTAKVREDAKSIDYDLKEYTFQPDTSTFSGNEFPIIKTSKPKQTTKEIKDKQRIAETIKFCYNNERGLPKSARFIYLAQRRNMEITRND